MSRGLGRIERAILEFLEGNAGLVDTLEIAGTVYGVPAVDGVVALNDAQVASTRRALRSLERCGSIVRVISRGRRKRSFWANTSVAERYAERLRLLNETMGGAA